MGKTAERDIVITDDIIHSIIENDAQFCQKIKGNKIDPINSVKHLTEGYRSALNLLHYLAAMKDRTELDGLKFLEVGSGNGFSLCYALKNGVDIVGVEPGNTFGFAGRYARAIKLLGINGINEPGKYLYDASAESLPFEDNSFDVVFSVAVLEHVRDLDLSMREMMRVLKPGGVLYANVPNYSGRWEGHYDIFWLPYMNKKTAKFYVRLFGRDPGFIDELIFTKPSLFSQYLDSREAHGRIARHGKSGSIYEAVKGFYHYFDNFVIPPPRTLPWHKMLIAYVLKATFVVTLFKYICGILLKILEYFGSVIIFDVILIKKK